MEPARSNQEWREDLRAPGPRRERALEDLRGALGRGMPFALQRWLAPTNPAFDALIEETIQETLMQALDKLDTFRGESKFTTWVHKIGIRLALSELRRKRWEDVSLQDLLGPDDAAPVLERLDAEHPNPDELIEQRDLIEQVKRYIDEELTERQRKALVAVGIKGMPTEEVARRLGTNRNALYKLLHDARLKLKGRLAQDGLDPAEILASFER